MIYSYFIITLAILGLSSIYALLPNTLRNNSIKEKFIISLGMGFSLYIFSLYVSVLFFKLTHNLIIEIIILEFLFFLGLGIWRQKTLIKDSFRRRKEQLQRYPNRIKNFVNTLRTGDYDTKKAATLKVLKKINFNKIFMFILGLLLVSFQFALLDIKFFYQSFLNWGFIGRDSYYWFSSAYNIFLYGDLSYKYFTSYPRGFDLLLSTIFMLFFEDQTYEKLYLFAHYFPIYNLTMITFLYYLFALSLFKNKKAYAFLTSFLIPTGLYFMSRAFNLVPSTIIDFNLLFILFNLYKLNEDPSRTRLGFSIAVMFLLHPLYALFITIVIFFHFFLEGYRRTRQEYNLHLKDLHIKKEGSVLFQTILTTLKENKIILFLIILYLSVFSLTLTIQYRATWYTQYFIYFHLSIMKSIKQWINYFIEIAQWYVKIVYKKTYYILPPSIPWGRDNEILTSSMTWRFIINFVPLFFALISLFGLFVKEKNLHISSKNSENHLLGFIKTLFILSFILYTLPDIKLFIPLLSSALESYSQSILYYYYKGRLLEICIGPVAIYLTYLFVATTRRIRNLWEKMVHEKSRTSKKIRFKLRGHIISIRIEKISKLLKSGTETIFYLFLLVSILNSVILNYAVIRAYVPAEYHIFLVSFRQSETEYYQEHGFSIENKSQYRTLIVDSSDKELLFMIHSQFYFDHEIIEMDLNTTFSEMNKTLYSLSYPNAFIVVSYKNQNFNMLKNQTIQSWMMNEIPCKTSFVIAFSLNKTIEEGKMA